MPPNERSTAGREIVITRVLNAPRDLVFRAWIDASEVDAWFAPHGFENRTLALDVRVSGVWRFDFVRNEPGTEHGTFPNEVVFLEVDAPRRLVYDHGTPGQPPDARVTVTFETRGNKTELTMYSVFPTAEARDEVASELGAVEGGKQMLERLEAHLARRGSTG